MEKGENMNLAKLIIKAKGNNTTYQFAQICLINYNYLDKLVKGQITEFPTRNELRRISDNSQGRVSYEQLLNVCNYSDNSNKEIFNVKQWEIYWVDFGNNNVGSEQNGVRPAVIIQNNIGNKYSPTVIAATITSQINKAKLPTHVEIKVEECGLEKDSVILIEQNRTIDKIRLISFIGVCPEHIIKKLNKAICIEFGIVEQFNYEIAYEYIEQIVCSKKIEKQFGKISEIIKIKNSLIKIFKGYCQQFNKDYNEVYKKYSENRTVINSNTKNEEDNCVYAH